jgi:Arc/MetJ-type ribon-helix-helix transcriptional regulator
MDVTLKPESEQFIDGLVRDGRCASAADVLEDALARLRLDPADRLDDEGWAAVGESEEQIARGQVRDFKDAAADLRRKHLGR